MFRHDTIRMAEAMGFPRIRGDVPALNRSQGATHTFSPHTRGCSQFILPINFGGVVFPAYAGMFLLNLRLPFVFARFPRIRGDVPGLVDTRKAIADVFPAYAGMFPLQTNDPVSCVCFPRIRGDVPPAVAEPETVASFSPHTRGCSVGKGWSETITLVFPAYAGMFLQARMYVFCVTRFPRIRGDVPPRAGKNRTQTRFSPHTRGCSGRF